MMERLPSVRIDGDRGFVHTSSKLIGRVKIGDQCIVHPLAKLDAGDGEIEIGDQCIIEERVEIVNRAGEHKMVIGNQNIINTGAKIYALKIGNHNVFNPKCVIGEKVRVSDCCVFNPKVEYLHEGVVPPHSVILADGSIRTTKSMPPSLEPHCEYLRNRMPKFGTAYKSKN